MNQKAHPQKPALNKKTCSGAPFCNEICEGWNIRHKNATFVYKVVPKGFTVQKNLILLIITLFCFCFAQAQKVGLVLSGGGAKGVAHIGVIRALEEAGIPIDYITGTSMGAIIGGMYAAGYSPKEMERMVTSEDFLRWVKGEIDEEYYFYYKRSENDASWINLQFQVDSTLTSSLPSSLVSPVQMDFVFMEYLASASAASKYDFDSLFIPFRCVASDIEANAPVVLREGDLGKAIRASMTFPFYFKPIRIKGKLLLDGGMYNNFPSDVMYEDFFPDIIIGSKVASNYPPPEEDDIISQVQTVFMQNSSYSVICENGVLIEPELERISITDFSRTQEFIDSGYAETKRAIPLIREFQMDSISQDQITAKRLLYRSKLPLIRVDSIVIEGLNPAQSEYVRRSLSGREGRTLDIDALKQEYFKLVADDKIAGIYPRLIYRPERSSFDLQLSLRKANNLELGFGGCISSSPTNEAFVELRYKHLGRQALSLSANSYIGRFYSSALAKARIDYPGRFPFYLRGGFVISQYDYFKTSTYFFEDKNPSYLIKNDNNLFLDLGWPVTNHGLIEAGFALGELWDDYYQENYFTREDTADRSHFGFHVARLTYDRSTLNRKQYASRGIQWKISLSLVDGKEKYIPGSTSNLETREGIRHQWVGLRTSTESYHIFGRNYTLGVYADLLISNHDFFETYTATLLSSPGFEPLPEMMTRFLPAYRAHSFLGIGLKHIFAITTNLDVRLESYFFQPYREIQRPDGIRPAYGETFSSQGAIGSGAVVFYSPIGPVSASLNYYDKSVDKWSFILNIGYVLFNRSVIER